MEEHLADLNKAQKAKLSRAASRAVELEDLRPPQGNQMIEPEVKGAAMCSGGAAGLARVVGSGRKKKVMMEMEGGFLGALASLAVPLIGSLFGRGQMTKEAHDKLMKMMNKRKVGEHTKMSGGFWGALAALAAPLIGKLFGKGAMTKSAHDELMSVVNKYCKSGSMKGGMKAELSGGAYNDPTFGVINEPAPKQMVPSAGVVGDMEGGAKYGRMLRDHLMKMKGAGFTEHFQQGFMGVAKPDIHSDFRSSGITMSAPAKMMEAKRKKAVAVAGAGRAGAGATGAGDIRKRRGQAVSRLMREEGMSLGQASKYLKEHPDMI